MATKTTNADHEKGTDLEGSADELAGTLADQLARSFTIGTDDEGFDHHYYRPADTVVVFDEDGVDHRQHLDGATVEEWVDHVDDKRGWMIPGPHASNGIRVDKQRKTGEH
jgi:hypothetical protein